MDSAHESGGFLGRGWGFPPEFQRHSCEVRMVAAEEDIRESLRILLSTIPGERLMHPEFGCGLNALMFEQMNESTVTALKDAIDRAVLFYEPRIILDGIDVDDGNIHDGVVLISLAYTVRSTNSRSNMVYPFYFLEGTDLRF
ncbi:GPW/gp25 family protein [Pelobacter propionicus]|uniref:GPW/gp25 family protein n=1 Tax=Pelobacter propionicus (strain DSM 2379 / NBRC 103807 / OttBd1) TaxID=338966 RepID=A1AKY1_PELPD|nr:GPW/gp25 family protein [Pelobacter propionicus]ABK98001.1 GPW/gp25 family protein [Pelobacter propionicus DSM 2379]